MTENNYQDKNAEDLLKDDFFVISILNPTDNTDAFWNKLIEEKQIDQKEFNKAKKALSNPSYAIEDLDIDKHIDLLWDRINETNNKKKKTRLYISYSIAAACFIGLLFLVDKQGTIKNNSGILMSDYRFDQVQKGSSSSNEIELIVGNNNEISIKSDNAHIKNTAGGVSINNDTLIKGNSSKKINYLQLIVPHGKRSKIDLIDGSHIIVNAGTRVIYPDKFVGNKREIYVDGEIFAKIAHDKSKPFIVRTNNLSIQVLGTTFNINAYESEASKSIVLVEGSVKVLPHSPNASSTILKPNQQYYIDKEEPRVATVNPENYTSWTEGIYRFKREPLQHILQRISKYYGVSVNCEPSVQNIICSGSLDLKDDINAVLYDVSLTTSLECIYSNNAYKFNKIRQVLTD